VKPYGTSLATATNWGLVFLVTYYSNEITKLIGFNGLFIMFSIFCILAAVFVWIFVPETKNKTFAEIQLELGGNLPSTSTGP
jgi:SP family facilitated glucose transporter-like MFS transporter 8